MSERQTPLVRRCAICMITNAVLLRFNLSRSTYHNGQKGVRGAGGLWLCRECWLRHAAPSPARRSEVARAAALARWAKVPAEERRTRTEAARHARHIRRSP